MGTLARGRRSAPQAHAPDCLPSGTTLWGDHQFEVGPRGPSAGVHYPPFIDTKTKKARQVPLTPAVRLALGELAKVRRLDTNHVFCMMVTPSRALRPRSREPNGSPGSEGFRFHDLRHCAATNLRRAGVDTATAMRIVGHKSEKMWKRYNAIDEKDLTKAASQDSTLTLKLTR